MAAKAAAKQNDLSNSESLYRSNASHHVSAQSNLQFGRRCPLKNFKMAAVAAILDIGTEQFQDGCHGCHLGYQNGTILEILNLYNAPMPPIHFRLNLTYGLGGDIV